MFTVLWIEFVEVEDLDGDLFVCDTVPRNAGGVCDELQVNILVYAVFIPLVTEDELHDCAPFFIAREVQSQLRTVADSELERVALQRGTPT